MTPKLILVDLDGTVADLHGEAFRRGYLRHPACRWNMEGCCLPNRMTHDALFANTELFAEAMPIVAADEGIHTLRTHGFRVQFVSTPWPTNHNVARAKYGWVERYFGDPALLTLTYDKALIPALALVDDRPNLVGPWEHWTYPQAWNDSILPTWQQGLADQLIEAWT